MFEDLPKSRKEAKQIGAKFYFTGKICPHGHLDKYITTGSCYTCLKIKTKARNQTQQGKDAIKKWRGTEQGKKSIRNTNLKRNYDINKEEFDNMIKNQNNKCSLCNSNFDPNNKNERACVDHNHQTGKVRELICGYCNTSMGLAKENIQTLENMIIYLRHHNSS